MKKYVFVLSMMALMLSSCKGEDNKVFPEEPDVTVPDDNPETDTPTVSSLNVNVGAKLNDWVATRSAVAFDVGKNKYDLAFTEGDRLHVEGYFEKEGNKYVIDGFTKVAVIEADGKSATFQGELKFGRMIESEDSPNDYEVEKAPYTFTSDDPLSECTSFSALLYPNGFTGGGNIVDGLFYEESKCIAPDVNTLIEKALPIVSQTYDKTTHSFRDFKTVTPILFFNLDTLNPESLYFVRMFRADSQAAFKEGKYEQFFITLNISGPFAFTILKCYEYGVYDGYWVLQFDEMNATDQLVYELGDIAFEPGKVYDLDKIIKFDN